MGDLEKAYATWFDEAENIGSLAGTLPVERLDTSADYEAPTPSKTSVSVVAIKPTAEIEDPDLPHWFTLDELLASQPLVGDVTGTTTDNMVEGIQGRPVAADAPTSGEALVWGGSEWAPGAPIPAAHDHPIEGDVEGSSLADARVVALRGRAVSATSPAESESLVWNGSAWEPAIVVWTPVATDDEIVTLDDGTPVVSLLNGDTAVVGGGSAPSGGTSILATVSGSGVITGDGALILIGVTA